jgi:Xaa-Pro aminopeptidase
MEDEKLDGLFISGEENVFYFSGLRIFTSWTSYPRPTFAFLPKNADPILLVQENHLLHAQLSSWIQDVRYYQELTGPPATMITETLRDSGMRIDRIGAEIGYEQRINMPAATFRQVETNLRTNFVDAAPLLWKMRMIKSKEEIVSIRRACEILGQAYTEAYQGAGEGITESELAASLRTAMCKRGAEKPAFLSMNTSSDLGEYVDAGKMMQHTRSLMSRPPSQRPLRKGDVVWIDSGATYKGYNSDYSRMLVLGKPTERQLRTYQLVQRITRKCVDEMKPGVKCSNIVKVCNTELKLAGSNVTFDRGRIGHGLGLLLTEPPHVGSYDDTIIEPNMVLTIEPGIITDYGCFHLEENLLITDTGSQVLSLSADTIKTGF